MAQVWTCPRGHRWEGEVKGSVANPRTRVLCPVCGALAMTPVRVAEGKPAKQAPPDETLAETLQFSDLVLPDNKPISTAPDVALDRAQRSNDKPSKGPGAGPAKAADQQPAKAPPAPPPAPGKEQPDR